MAPSVDPALLEALKLDPSTTRISSHGGSGFSATFRLTTVVGGEEVSYFVKTGTGPDAEVMFRGKQVTQHYPEKRKKKKQKQKPSCR